MSSSLSGSTPPDGPPIWIALNLRFLGRPPPTSKTNWRTVVPIGTSTSPVVLILPASEKTCVPVLVLVPMPANHLPPRSTISDTMDQVLTLLRHVG